MGDSHIVITTISFVFNWTIGHSGSTLVGKDCGFYVSKQGRLRSDATFNRLKHGSALFADFTFAAQLPDSPMSIAWNWREPNIHL